MEFESLNAGNREALDTYCEILIMLRDMIDKTDPERAPHPRNAVINHVISSLLRKATDSIHARGYSHSGKKAAHYISTSARKQLEGGNNNDLILEHVIPVGVLNKEIKNSWENWTARELREFLLKFTLTAIVTKAEDQLLKDNDLVQKMPPEIDQLSDGIDKFARYNIIVNENVLIKIEELQDTLRRRV